MDSTLGSSSGLPIVHHCTFYCFGTKLINLFAFNMEFYNKMKEPIRRTFSKYATNVKHLDDFILVDPWSKQIPMHPIFSTLLMIPII